MSKTILLSLILIICARGFSQNSPLKDLDPIFGMNETSKAPEFPGGIDSLYSYISKSFVYPIKSRIKNEQGTLYISFVIEKDGTVGGVQVIKGVSKALDAEGYRVISECPKWIPGQIEGKLVRVQYVIPLRLSLSN